MKTSGLGNVIELERTRALRSDGGLSSSDTNNEPRPSSRRRARRRIIAVGGGKGGIGKTLVSSSLGIALAQGNRRVVLLDADLGGANLHTALGVAQPAHTLSDFIEQKTKALDDVMVPSGVPNLSLIAGAHDVLDAANMKYRQKVKLLREIQGLDVDYLILDLGAGTTFNTLDFFLVADHGLLVLLPEPTSVENAFRFVKAAFFRKLQNLAESYGIGDRAADLLSTRSGGMKSVNDFITQLRNDDRELGDAVRDELMSFRAKLIVNQARTQADQSVGSAVAATWRKLFGLDLDYLGAVLHDDEAWKSVRKRRPVLIEQPDCGAARGLHAIAQKLIEIDDRDDASL